MVYLPTEVINAVKALRDDRRFEILFALSENELSFSQLSEITDLKSAKLNYHLQPLIENALVDTGATMLNLHKNQIDELGLKYLRKMRVKTANGSIERNIYGVASVEIMGREAEFDVLEIPDDVPVLVGYIILEQLDFVADPIQQKLVPNPAHDGEYALDLY